MGDSIQFTNDEMVDFFAEVTGATNGWIEPEPARRIVLYAPLAQAQKLKSVLVAIETLIVWKPDAKRVPRLEAALAALRSALSAAVVDKELGYVAIGFSADAIETLRHAYTPLREYAFLREHDRTAPPPKKKRGPR